MWPMPGSVTLAQRGSTEASSALIARTGDGEVSPPSSSTGIRASARIQRQRGREGSQEFGADLGHLGASRSLRPASIAAQVPAPDQ